MKFYILTYKTYGFIQKINLSSRSRGSGTYSSITLLISGILVTNSEWICVKYRKSPRSPIRKFLLDFSGKSPWPDSISFGDMMENLKMFNIARPPRLRGAGEGYDV